VRVTLTDGRVLVREAHGARGYPVKPATPAELETKFLACARRAVPEEQAQRTLSALREFEQRPDVSF
jgi:hypothetical protein